MSQKIDTGATYVRIRQVTEKDLPALEWDGAYTHFRRLYKTIYLDSQTGKNAMLIAENAQNNIVGQAFIQFHGHRKALADGTTKAYIFAVRVKPEFRNHGIGTKLILTAEKVIKKKKFTTATLNVAKDNLDAIRFYKRLGYRIVAHEPGKWAYIDHRGNLQHVNQPSWRMEKDLNDLND